MRTLICLILLMCFLPFPALSDQIVTLQNGFNFVGLLAETPTLTSSQLFTEITALDSIFRFDSTNQSFDFQLKLPDGKLFGSSFPLQAGEGYVLKATAASTYTFIGSEPTAIQQPSLVAGFTFLAIPTLSTLRSSGNLLETHSTVKSIFRWNSTRQAFDFQLKLPDNSNFGESMTLQAGDACFVNSSGSGTLFFSTEITPGTSRDLVLLGAYLNSTVTRNSNSPLNVVVIGATDLAQGLYYDLSWKLEPLVGSTEEVIDSLVLTGSRRLGPAVVGLQTAEISILIPDHKGNMRVTARIEAGAPLDDPTPANNTIDPAFVVVDDPPFGADMKPSLSLSSIAINEDFTISGLGAAGTDLSSIRATIIKGGAGYPCHVISTNATAGTATFHAWEEAQTAGSFEILLSIPGRNWYDQSLGIHLKPVIQEHRTGNVFKVLGVGYDSIYLSIYNNGTYNLLNTSSETATVDGATTTIRHLARQFVLLPAIGTSYRSQRQIVITVNGEDSAPYTATVDGWEDGQITGQTAMTRNIVLSQTGYYYPPTYLAGIGDTLNFINGDIRDRSVEIPGLSLDTGQMAPGDVQSITITGAGELAMNFYYYTTDGKSAPDEHTLKITLLGPGWTRSVPYTGGALTLYGPRGTTLEIPANCLKNGNTGKISLVKADANPYYLDETQQTNLDFPYAILVDGKTVRDDPELVFTSAPTLTMPYDESLFLSGRTADDIRIVYDDQPVHWKNRGQRQPARAAATLNSAWNFIKGTASSAGKTIAFKVQAATNYAIVHLAHQPSETVDSGGHYQLIYYLTGPYATTQAQANVADSALKSASSKISTLGFKQPTGIKIKLLPLGAELDGAYVSSLLGDSYAAIELNSELSTTRLESSAPHEYFHACQALYQTDLIGSMPYLWFDEATALFMEEHVNPLNNSYTSLVTDNYRSFVGGGLGSNSASVGYGAGAWAVWITEQKGTGFVRSVYEKLQQQSVGSRDAMPAIIEVIGQSDFPASLTDFFTTFLVHRNYTDAASVTMSAVAGVTLKPSTTSTTTGLPVSSYSGNVMAVFLSKEIQKIDGVDETVELTGTLTITPTMTSTGTVKIFKAVRVGAAMTQISELYSLPGPFSGVSYTIGSADQPLSSGNNDTILVLGVNPTGTSNTIQVNVSITPVQ